MRSRRADVLIGGERIAAVGPDLEARLEARSSTPAFA
jgi:hypothetical protein